MRFLILSCLLFVSIGLAIGDDRLRDAQSILKEKGFYYGEVDGVGGEETTAAIKRFQIRNGLRVTGKLDDETARALGGDLGGQPPNNVVGQPSNREVERTPDQDESRRLIERDREFLLREQTRPQEQEQVKREDVEPEEEERAEEQREWAGYNLDDFFADTPYENARVEEQIAVLQGVQIWLRRYGYYDGYADGIPGPMTRRGLRMFQDYVGLDRTGRLDYETLGTLRILPGQRRAGRGYGGSYDSRRGSFRIWFQR